MEKTYLTYEEFGAVGDGVHDDFEAIIATHNAANERNLPVRANDGATYYIGGKNAHATVKTSVNFGKAKFMIDDRNVEDRTSHVFIVESDYKPYEIEISSLKKTDKKVNFPHEGNAYVKVINDDHKMFIRRGLNLNAGVGARDVFLVDAEGNILTDIDWNFEKVTRAFAKCIDDEPIIIEGGIFTTIANEAESFYNYHNRGFSIRRANVKVRDFTHYVTGEGSHGAPYGGFVTVGETAHVTIENSIFTPRFIFFTPSKIPGKGVAMGSYDISLGESIDVKLIGVCQTVNVKDQRYWGIFTSNFCKDLYFENCMLSRFDAHQGVTNVTIKNSVFGHQCINLIGHGKAIIENCHIYGRRLSDLRFDYGSIWDGDIIVKNLNWHPSGNPEWLSLITATNTGNHDFGYECCMPKTVTVDGLTVHDEECPDTKFYILPDYDIIRWFALPEWDNPEGKPFPYKPTEKLVLKNVKFMSGREYKALEKEELYPGIVIEID
jgi:hypothetical protein